MITEKFLRGRSRHAMRPDEIRALENAIHEVVEIPARMRLVERAELVDRSYYLVEGYVCRHLDDRQGERQLVGVQVPGDFVDLHGFPTKRLDHDVAALSEAKLAVFLHDGLEKLVADYPHLARILWFSTLLDAAMHREWIFRLGRLNAEGRVAHLICELAERLRFVGLFDGRTFPIPLRQQDFAEACGITPVHTNRVFRALRNRDVISAHEKGSGLFVEDEAALRQIGEFSPDYLYGVGELEVGDALDG